MSESELVFPFGIDDGQLDGLSPQDVFVIGYELGAIYATCERGESFSGLIHAENANRVLSVCQKFGYVTPKWIWNSDDAGEAWIECALVKAGEVEA